MIFIKFKDTFEKAGIFSVNNIKSVFSGFYPQYLTHWQAKGYIIKLRNGWYCFPEFLKRKYALWQTANLIYYPSYISLESALFYYELLPEAVFGATSISTNKTYKFDTPAGRFTYGHVKRNLFFGYHYHTSSDNGISTLIAEPEKALLDFFYLNPWYDSEIKLYELRFNKIVLRKDVVKEKLYTYLKKYNNPTLEKKINLLYKIYL